MPSSHFIHNLNDLTDISLLAALLISQGFLNWGPRTPKETEDTVQIMMGS